MHSLCRFTNHDSHGILFVQECVEFHHDFAEYDSDRNVETIVFEHVLKIPKSKLQVAAVRS